MRHPEIRCEVECFFQPVQSFIVLAGMKQELSFEGACEWEQWIQFPSEPHFAESFLVSSNIR
jgi:hypothetical protein